jgi:predicted nuclease of restriction endonuclease-like (RecB) superfamily
VRANDIENFVLTLIDAFVNVTAQRLNNIDSKWTMKSVVKHNW